MKHDYKVGDKVILNTIENSLNSNIVFAETHYKHLFKEKCIVLSIKHSDDYPNIIRITNDKFKKAFSNSSRSGYWVHYKDLIHADFLNNNSNEKLLFKC